MIRSDLLIPLGLAGLAVLFTACQAPEGDAPEEGHAGLTAIESLGKRVFFDPNLSSPPGQSCAHCHSPASGHGDPRFELPVSQGSRPERFGNRNDMTASYAAFIPPLHYDEAEELWLGGLFWDGRAADLVEQAKGPLLNPLEMANPDVEAVAETLRKASYRDEFLEVFGEDALDDADRAYQHLAEAIAAYERSAELSPFDSKYDRYLAGEVELTPQELRGLALFDDEAKGNCAACHPSAPGSGGSPPLFTDFTYDNLGTPRNPELPFYSLPAELNPDGADWIDLGLGLTVGDPAENGKFRVPTLRNVALTPPYMHNGVFKTLFQVVAFYNSRDVAPWPGAEVPETMNREELGDLGLTTQEMLDIVAFLETLSDGGR